MPSPSRARLCHARSHRNDLDEATGLVTGSGLKTVFHYHRLSARPTAFAGNLNGTAPNPTVVGQTPAPGTRVTPGTNVSLQVPPLLDRMYGNQLGNRQVRRCFRVSS